MEPILVTGGTGTLGQHVVRQLREGGREVRVLTRKTDQSQAGVQFLTGDLVSGNGVDAAVEGVASIIHCAGGPKFEEAATRNLIRAAASSGSPHIVYISIVGVDRIPVKSAVDRMMFGYYEMKRRTEELVAESGLPWSTLRATQFHDLVFSLIRSLVKSPLVPTAAGVGFQPVAADEVATRLVEMAARSPSRVISEMGGPRTYGMAEMIHAYLQRSGQRRILFPFWIPGEAARAFRSGANLAPLHAVGRKTWESYLNERLMHGPMRARLG